MITESVAYDMGERCGVNGWNGQQTLALIALGWTDSESFCKVYEAFEMGEAEGVRLVNRFGGWYGNGGS